MKRAFLLTLTIVAAIFFAACSGAPADNKPANTNTNANANAAKPTAAAPTKEALVALENKAFEAWKSHDAKFWETFLVDNYVGLDEDGKHYNKAALVEMMSKDKCEITKSSFSDEQMTPAGADAAIITYKIAYEGKCEGQTMPSNVWAASVYVRSGDTWKGAYHNEMPVMEAKPESEKKADDGDKKAAAEDKKGEDKKTETPAQKTAEKPAEAATDDPLVASVKKGWEAWKDRDMKTLGDGLAKDFVFITPMGTRLDGAGAIKAWGENKCEVKSVSFADAQSTMFGKDMGIVTLKGTGNGTCNGGPAGSLFGSYVLVKDGDMWKAAMIFETPAM